MNILNEGIEGLREEEEYVTTYVFFEISFIGKFYIYCTIPDKLIRTPVSILFLV